MSQGARCRRRWVREGLAPNWFPGSKTGYELAHRRFAYPVANAFMLPNLFAVPEISEIQNRLQNFIAFSPLLEVQH